MNASRLAPRLLSSIAVVAVLGLAACGGSGDGAGDSASAASASTGGETVGVSTIDGSQVLVDASGNALYSPDQEANGKISCTGSCETIWMPLAASGGAKPTAAADVSGTLGTVKRPDGSLQVTLDGAPLYTFSEDGGPGTVTGDGFADQFDGKSFTWHVASADGAAGSAGSGESPSTTTSSNSGGYSY
jgi:predicted lipoprotein with Yx(FWY)xxD motif